MNTKGHLSTNGGVRGHSAGSFFPILVRGKGNVFLPSFRWQVVLPSGEVVASYRYVRNAFKAANIQYFLRYV